MVGVKSAFVGNEVISTTIGSHFLRNGRTKEEKEELPFCVVFKLCGQQMGSSLFGTFTWTFMCKRMMIVTQLHTCCADTGNIYMVLHIQK